MQLARRCHSALLAAALLALLGAGCGPSTTGNNNNTNTSNCTGGLVDCGGVCVDIMSDTNHCGGCDQPCFLPNVCDGNGQCGAACSGNTVNCDGSCVDINFSTQHCGDCNQPCPTNYVCDNRVCTDDACTETSSTAESGVLPADIIVVVDNSGSMTEEAQFVQNSMNSFAQTIASSGIDYHVILISDDSNDSNGICVPSPLGSGSCPNDDNLPTFHHVVQAVGSSNSFDLILSTYSQWSADLRPNATKTITVISDDNSSMTAVDFQTAMVNLDPTFQGFVFHAIFAPYDPGAICNPITCTNCACDTCCGLNMGVLCAALPADEGTNYRDLVQMTGGVEGDLCLQDFLPAFQAMATAVVGASQVDCVYDIPDPPTGETINYGEVNVEFTPTPGANPETFFYVPGGAADCGPSGGWYYDNSLDPLQILFCPATCTYVEAAAQGAVSVKFGCATVVE